MRQGPRQVLRTVKARARVNAWTYSPRAFESLVDSSIYDEDVQRAFSTASLLETHEHPCSGSHYVLQGFGMNEEPLVLVCRLQRRLIEIVELYWD